MEQDPNGDIGPTEPNSEHEPVNNKIDDVIPENDPEEAKEVTEVVEEEVTEKETEETKPDSKTVDEKACLQEPGDAEEANRDSDGGDEDVMELDLGANDTFEDIELDLAANDRFEDIEEEEGKGAETANEKVRYENPLVFQVDIWPEDLETGTVKSFCATEWSIWAIIEPKGETAESGKYAGVIVKSDDIVLHGAFLKPKDFYDFEDILLGREVKFSCHIPSTVKIENIRSTWKCANPFPVDGGRLRVARFAGIGDLSPACESLRRMATRNAHFLMSSGKGTLKVDHDGSLKVVIDLASKVSKEIEVRHDVCQIHLNTPLAIKKGQTYANFEDFDGVQVEFSMKKNRRQSFLTRIIHPIGSRSSTIHSLDLEKGEGVLESGREMFFFKVENVDTAKIKEAGEGEHENWEKFTFVHCSRPLEATEDGSSEMELVGRIRSRFGIQSDQDISEAYDIFPLLEEEGVEGIEIGEPQKGNNVKSQSKKEQVIGDGGKVAFQIQSFLWNSTKGTAQMLLRSSSKRDREKEVFINKSRITWLGKRVHGLLHRIFKLGDTIHLHEKDLKNLKIVNHQTTYQGLASVPAKCEMTWAANRCLTRKVMASLQHGLLDYVGESLPKTDLWADVKIERVLDKNGQIAIGTFTPKNGSKKQSRILVDACVLRIGVFRVADLDLRQLAEPKSLSVHYRSTFFSERHHVKKVFNVTFDVPYIATSSRSFAGQQSSEKLCAKYDLSGIVGSSKNVHATLYQALRDKTRLSHAGIRKIVPRVAEDAAKIINVADEDSFEEPAEVIEVLGRNGTKANELVWDLVIVKLTNKEGKLCKVKSTQLYGWGCSFRTANLSEVLKAGDKLKVSLNPQADSESSVPYTASNAVFVYGGETHDEARGPSFNGYLEDHGLNREMFYEALFTTCKNQPTIGKAVCSKTDECKVVPGLFRELFNQSKAPPSKEKLDKPIFAGVENEFAEMEKAIVGALSRYTDTHKKGPDVASVPSHPKRQDTKPPSSHRRSEQMPDAQDWRRRPEGTESRRGEKRRRASPSPRRSESRRSLPHVSSTPVMYGQEEGRRDQARRVDEANCYQGFGAFPAVNQQYQSAFVPAPFASNQVPYQNFQPTPVPAPFANVGQQFVPPPPSLNALSVSNLPNPVPLNRPGAGVFVDEDPYTRAERELLMKEEELKRRERNLRDRMSIRLSRSDPRDLRESFSSRSSRDTLRSRDSLGSRDRLASRDRDRSPADIRQRYLLELELEREKEKARERAAAEEQKKQMQMELLREKERLREEAKAKEDLWKREAELKTKELELREKKLKLQQEKFEIDRQKKMFDQRVTGGVHVGPPGPLASQGSFPRPPAPASFDEQYGRWGAQNTAREGHAAGMPPGRVDFMQPGNVPPPGPPALRPPTDYGSYQGGVNNPNPGTSWGGYYTGRKY